MHWPGPSKHFLISSLCELPALTQANMFGPLIGSVQPFSEKYGSSKSSGTIFNTTVTWMSEAVSSNAWPQTRQYEIQHVLLVRSFSSDESKSRRYINCISHFRRGFDFRTYCTHSVISQNSWAWVHAAECVKIATPRAMGDGPILLDLGGWCLADAYLLARNSSIYSDPAQSKRRV
jgi:hypothetical protein